MDDKQSFLDLQIDEEAGNQLTDTSRWAKLLAIIVLSFTAIFTLMLTAVWGNLQEFAGMSDTFDSRNIGILKVVLAICIVIFVVIVVILMTFLLKGAKALRAGIQRKDPVLVTAGLGHLRNYLAMMGVLSLIGLVFLLLGFFVR